MIEAIYYLGIVVAILVNLTALTLIVFRSIPFPAIARVTGILGVCLALFTLEHFVGLGKLYPLYIPLTALSLYIIWHERALYEPISTSQIVFVCALAYGSLWRLASPEIRDDGDRIPDFHLLANYFAGDKLPPLDFWLPHQQLDYYYTFQHYAAALLGRIFGLSPGESFNFGSVLLISLVLTLAWEFLTLVRVRFGMKLLAIAALAIGGTGSAPFFHLITKAWPDAFLSYGSAMHAVIYNSKFVGWFENSVASDAWRAAFGDETARAVLLPIETLGHHYAIGSYHAVLSGFLLQFLALAIIVAMPQATAAVRARLEFVLGLTVPMTLCASGWDFPLQAALVGAWKFWDLRAGNRGVLPLIGGAGTGVLLLLPFLVGLTNGTQQVHFELVPPDAHAPILQFLVVWWPLLVLVAAILLAGGLRSLPGFLAILFLTLLVAAEVFNVRDVLMRAIQSGSIRC